MLLTSAPTYDYHSIPVAMGLILHTWQLAFISDSCSIIESCDHSLQPCGVGVVKPIAVIHLTIKATTKVVKSGATH